MGLVDIQVSIFVCPYTGKLDLTVMVIIVMIARMIMMVTKVSPWKPTGVNSGGPKFLFMVVVGVWGTWRSGC